MTVCVVVIAFQFVPGAPVCRRESEIERKRGSERGRVKEKEGVIDKGARTNRLTNRHTY